LSEVDDDDDVLDRSDNDDDGQNEVANDAS